MASCRGGKGGQPFALPNSQGKIIETFHPGNCVYKGDVCTLVGIVRWQKETDVELSKNFTEYLDADLFRAGAYVDQSLSQ